MGRRRGYLNTLKVACDTNFVTKFTSTKDKGANFESQTAVQIRSTLTFPVIWAPV
eukprot:SAG11_NODE_4433_length_1896_cov_1.523094_1_plen_54_part_01